MELIYTGDVLEVLANFEDESVDTVVTSPPYWSQRDYGVEGQIGLESDPFTYVDRLAEVFEEVRRVLTLTGSLWLNMGDTFCSTAPGTKGDKLHARGILSGVSETVAQSRVKVRPSTPQGMKPKDLVGLPWMMAFALRDLGWYLRMDVIWQKPNILPESVKDRPTKAHEYLFLLTKSPKYYYNGDAIREPAEWARWGNQTTKKKDETGKSHGSQIPDRTKEEIAAKFGGTRNARSVWSIPTKPFKGSHFATMPPALAERCLKATGKPGGLVLDPFMGSGTTLVVAKQLGLDAVGIELNPDYVEIAQKRLEEGK